MSTIPNNPQERRQGTGFTNLNRILDANKQNVLGQTIGGGIQQQAQGVRSGLNEQTQQFQQDAASARVGTDENRQLTQDVLGRFNSQSGFSGVQEPEIQKFQQIQAGYLGPMGLSQEKLGQLQGKAQTAQQLGQATRSAGGKDELLRQFVGGQGYTQGKQRLDSTLLGQTGSKDLAQARRSTFGLGQDLQKQQTAASEIGKQFQTEGQRFGQDVKGQLQGLFDPLQSTVQQRPDELRGQWEARRSELFTKLQNEEELSPQDIQDLGWTDEDALQYNLLSGISGRERITGAKMWAPILLDIKTQKYGTDAYRGMADFLGVPVSGIDGQVSPPKYSDLVNAVTRLTPEQAEAFGRRFTSGGGATFNIGVGKDLYDTISKAPIGHKLEGLTADNDIGFGTNEAAKNLRRLAGRSDFVNLMESGVFDNVNLNDPDRRNEAEQQRIEQLLKQDFEKAVGVPFSHDAALEAADRGQFSFLDSGAWRKWQEQAKKEIDDYRSLSGSYRGSGDNYHRYGTLLRDVTKVTPDFAFENYIPQANLGDLTSVTAAKRDELAKLNALRQLQGQEPIYSDEQLNQAGTAKLNVQANKEMLPYAARDLLGKDFVKASPDGSLEVDKDKIGSTLAELAAQGFISNAVYSSIIAGLTAPVVAAAGGGAATAGAASSAAGTVMVPMVAMAAAIDVILMATGQDNQMPMSRSIIEGVGGIGQGLYEFGDTAVDGFGRLFDAIGF